MTIRRFRVARDGVREPLTPISALQLAEKAYDEERLDDAFRLVEVAHALAGSDLQHSDEILALEDDFAAFAQRHSSQANRRAAKQSLDTIQAAGSSILPGIKAPNDKGPAVVDLSDGSQLVSEDSGQDEDGR